jgi:hydroxyquinol 1,2-dioxygenase
MPQAYPIPTDGPVGTMLAATARQPMRPAHIHVMIAKPGYDTLITHVFVNGDKWLDRDAVFGVRSTCIGDFARREPGQAPDGRILHEPFYVLDYPFNLSAQQAA